MFLPIARILHYTYVIGLILLKFLPCKIYHYILTYGPTFLQLLFSCLHGDLYHYVHYSEELLPENIVIEILRQLLKAVSFMHSKSIVHLDIKVSCFIELRNDDLKQ